MSHRRRRRAGCGWNVKWVWSHGQMLFKSSSRRAATGDRQAVSGWLHRHVRASFLSKSASGEENRKMLLLVFLNKPVESTISLFKASNGLKVQADTSACLNTWNELCIIKNGSLTTRNGRIMFSSCFISNTHELATVFSSLTREWIMERSGIEPMRLLW